MLFQSPAEKSVYQKQGPTLGCGWFLVGFWLVFGGVFFFFFFWSTHSFAARRVWLAAAQLAKFSLTQPVQFPDTVTVMHKVEPLTAPDRFILSGVVVSHNAKKVAARIKETIVTVDYTKGGIKAAIPAGVKGLLEELAKKTTNAPKK